MERININLFGLSASGEGTIAVIAVTAIAMFGIAVLALRGLRYLRRG